MWPQPSPETSLMLQKDSYTFSKTLKNASRQNRKENQMLAKQVRGIELMQKDSVTMTDHNIRKMSSLKVTKETQSLIMSPSYPSPLKISTYKKSSSLRSSSWSSSFSPQHLSSSSSLLIESKTKTQQQSSTGNYRSSVTSSNYLRNTAATPQISRSRTEARITPFGKIYT